MRGEQWIDYPNRHRVRGTFAQTAFITRHYSVPAKAIHPDVRMGHVHLKVADLERALGFYRDVLGFDMMRSGIGCITNLPPSWAARSLHRLGLTSQPEVRGLPPLPLALVSCSRAG